MEVPVDDADEKLGKMKEEINANMKCLVGELAVLLKNASIGGSCNDTEERPRKNARTSPVASSSTVPRESRRRGATNNWLLVEEDIPMMIELGSEIASSIKEHNEAFRS